MKRLGARRGLTLLGITCLLFACSASPDASTPEGTDGTAPAETTDDALTSPKSVALMYEGTCDFLHACSSYSRRLPDGEVQWGCGGTACEDDARWMAGPSHTYCNRTAKVCRGSKCTTATIKDISNAHGWEASNGVLDALGLPHTVDVDACSGSGGGRVTVQLL